jgi:hypothetical protein
MIAALSGIAFLAAFTLGPLGWVAIGAAWMPLGSLSP